MKKNTLILLLGVFTLFNFKGFAQDTSLLVFDQILFYDGYAAVVNQPVPEGIIRHRNDLYAKKLSETDLQGIGNTLTLNATIKAACDNYDRIGNVNLALVPKNSTTYVPNNVQRLELGRFITPFMNKNKTPDEVVYTFNIDNIAALFKDPALNEMYDFWMELQLFGVPYAAQTQISGCTGRNDVFFGSLELVSNITTPFISTNNFLLPLNFQKNLNNYEEGASDAIGTSARTINFDLPYDLTDATFYFITSNHGANAGGEEYSRRWHLIYFDGVQKMYYKPGETSCEPYRIYNTQSNGIYTSTKLSDSQWQSFSNWCPGAKIPIRTLAIGNMTAGSHAFKISIPTAVFNEGQGNIPVSVYLQGKASQLGVEDLNKVEFSLYPNPSSDKIQINASENVKNFKVYNMFGQQIEEGFNNLIDLSKANYGVYMATITFVNDKKVTQKIIKN